MATTKASVKKTSAGNSKLRTPDDTSTGVRTARTPMTARAL